MLSQVVLQFLFQLAFDHAFAGSITVSFSVCSLTMLSQVALQFLFQLAFDHAFAGNWFYYSFFFSLQFDYALTGCITVCCMVTPKIKGKSMPLSAIMHTVSLHRHNGILSVYTVR